MCGAAKAHFRALLQSFQCPAGALPSVAARAAAAEGVAGAKLGALPYSTGALAGVEAGGGWRSAA